jgi:hypothetical protein
MCCTIMAAHSNTGHKMWKCAASAVASFEGLNELVRLCHICIDVLVYSIKYIVIYLPPPIYPACCHVIFHTDGWKQLSWGGGGVVVIE